MIPTRPRCLVPDSDPGRGGSFLFISTNSFVLVYFLYYAKKEKNYCGELENESGNIGRGKEDCGGD